MDTPPWHLRLNNYVESTPELDDRLNHHLLLLTVNRVSGSIETCITVLNFWGMEQ